MSEGVTSLIHIVLGIFVKYSRIKITAPIPLRTVNVKIKSSEDVDSIIPVKFRANNMAESKYTFAPLPILCKS